MRSRTSRTMATLTVAVITAIVATLLAAAPANAARRHGGFHGPTTVRFAGATCTQIDGDAWRVTYRWVVRGGRYANLGSGEDATGWVANRTYDDLVRHGGRRIVTNTAYRLTNTPGAENTPNLAVYRQYIAPVGNPRNVIRTRARSFTRTVNFTCE